MADLREFEKRLNGNRELLARFLKNPVAVMKEEGFNLTAEMEESLRGATELGFTVRPMDPLAKPKWEVEIPITIKVSGGGDDPSPPPPPPPPPSP